MSLTQSVTPQNALLALGNSSTSSSNVLVSSSSNSFTNVLSGATLQVNSATGNAVSVTVSNDDTDLSSAIQAMVNDYNTFQSALTSDTAYDTSTDTGGVLANDPTATQLGSEVSGLMNGMISGAGSITALVATRRKPQLGRLAHLRQLDVQHRVRADPDAVNSSSRTQPTGSRCSSTI